MAEDPISMSIPEVENLILSLYQPNPPEIIKRTQAILSRLQDSPEAWGLARDLLARPEEQVRFFGALTIVIKLNNESSSLTPENAAELLVVMIGRYLDTLRSGTSPLVARKLASALATFFLNFHQVWSRFIHHLILCLVSGQPCQPDALHEAPDSSSLIERMDASQLQPVLWVLKNVLDEVTKINLNSPKNIGVYDAILENLPDAVALMSRGMSPQVTTGAAHEDAIQCLQSWVWFAQKSSSRDTRLSEPIGPLITAAITSLTIDELYSVSAELMTDLLSNCLLFLTDSHFENLAQLFDTPWSQRRYQELVQGDFDFDCVQFGQLMLAFGEARIDRLMQSDDSGSQRLLSNLCGLLAAQGDLVEDRIFVPALEFWLTYAETMTDSMYSDPESINTWVPQARSHALQAVSNAWQKIVYPPTKDFLSWDSSERISFSSARKDVVDLLQSVYTLVGPQLVATFADLVLKALSESSWFQLEAAAFCLGGLADCTSDDSRCDDALAVVFRSSLFATLRSGQGEVPSRVRQTCVALIERYTEYFERNISELHPALNFIFGFVGEHAMANAAAKSILRLCGSCRGALHTEAHGFLNEYQNLVSGERLDCAASEKVVGGIAAVIQAMPDPIQKYSACARLLGFVQADVQRSLELLQSPSDNPVPCFGPPRYCAYAAPDESPALHTALKSLRCLASIGKGLQASSEVSVDLDGGKANTQTVDPQLIQLQGTIMSIISQIQESFNGSGEVVELICSALRSGFSESEPGPFVLPPHSVAQYLTYQGLQTPRVGLLVKTACSFVSSLEHDGLENQQEMLNSVLLWVIGLLKQLPSHEADPELSQNGIDFVTRLLNKRPVTLLRLEPSNAAEFFFLFTLEVLDGKEPLPKTSAAEFWSAFVSTKYESQELNDVAQQAMQMLGPLLAQSLARNLGGNASRSELDKLSEPLKKLVVRYPMAKSWLEAGLAHETFPSDKLSPQDKTVFVKKVISLRGARATNQVVRDFWQSARGSNFAYAS
ncbi:hypothetical protein FIE12Z_10637 [Fusarium flagelliforme]|uniref:Uncharacterized protein n=1 Tax=Fusarium flagelliforme TaxID=2675880 RepID=A0A395MB22_9HYPO|nr:hypothetical protein FIE12Z_10637 [Fusarium flagelliforme]